MKKRYLLIICLCLWLTPVQAFYCRYEDLSYYKKIASNINVSYDYEVFNNGVTFTTTITNLQPDYYIVDTATGIRYNYTGEDIQIKGYRSGQTIQYTVYTTQEFCEDQILSTIRLTLPTYNRYYNDEVCKDASEYSLCSRWSSHGLDYETFVDKVNQYKENKNKGKPPVVPEEEIPDNSIVQWVLRLARKYYYVFLVIVIVISGIGIYKINKKDSMYY